MFTMLRQQEAGSRFTDVTLISTLDSCLNLLAEMEGISNQKKNWKLCVNGPTCYFYDQRRIFPFDHFISAYYTYIQINCVFSLSCDFYLLHLPFILINLIWYQLVFNVSF